MFPERAHEQTEGRDFTAGGAFDPTRAEAPVRLVPLALVVDPLPVTHAPERIEEYRCAMERGARFPPIAVVAVAGRFLVADGHKRFSAHRALAGGGVLYVQVWTRRRWLRDQARQLRAKSAQQLRLAGRSAHDPAARRAARRLLGDTLGHWRRIARSLRAHWRARRGDMAP